MYGTVRVLRNIIYAATAKGGNLNKLCAALGMYPSDLHDADRKIEGVTPVMDLWTEVIASTGDQAFGLHMGLENKPSVLGLPTRPFTPFPKCWVTQKQAHSTGI